MYDSRRFGNPRISGVRDFSLSGRYGRPFWAWSCVGAYSRVHLESRPGTCMNGHRSYGCVACMRTLTGYSTGSQCHSEEDCPALVPAGNGACAKTPLLSALPGYMPGTWVKTMPGGHVTQDAPGMAALDGDMIMATDTMISEMPIRILPVFIGGGPRFSCMGR